MWYSKLLREVKFEILCKKAGTSPRLTDLTYVCLDFVIQDDGTCHVNVVGAQEAFNFSLPVENWAADKRLDAPFSIFKDWPDFNPTKLRKLNG